MTQHRRSFLKAGLVTAAGILAAEASAHAAHVLPEEHTRKIELPDDAIILFQGDSITDHGRKRDDSAANSLDAMGRGYAALAASELLRRYPRKKLNIYNRGISGNKVPQLADRWDTDCLQLKPNVVSILIGVNDYWHKRNGQYDGSADAYGQQLRDLISRTRNALPGVQLLVGEPFGVRGVHHVDDSWFPEFGAYQRLAREIAHENDAVFIPYQKFFDEATKQAAGAYWTTDGVHTTLAGINLMAHHWLQHIR